MHGGGWTIAPVWLKDLRQLRPCLLYICIALFHQAAADHQWSSSSYLSRCNSVSSGSPSCLPGWERGGEFICNHLVWLTRMSSDQYPAPDPEFHPGDQDETWKHRVFNMTSFGRVEQKSSFRFFFFSETTLKCVPCVNHRLSETSSTKWRADLLTALIAFGSMP